jgi:hypothetical protein
VADINCKGTVAQHATIIALGHAVKLGQYETLQASDGGFVSERIKRGSPVLLEESRVLVGPRLFLSFSICLALVEAHSGLTLEDKAAIPKIKFN